jgi:hypothetical protein
MFLIDVAAQNAYALFNLQNKTERDMFRDRQKRLEDLAFQLIKFSVLERYNDAILQNLYGRTQSQTLKIEEFLANVRQSY